MTTPEIKTETVSEVVFTNAKLLELIRTFIGADVVPPNAEVKPYFPVAEFGGVRIRWTCDQAEKSKNPSHFDTDEAAR